MGVEISVHYIARGWCAACAVGLFAVGMTQLMAISWQIVLVMVSIIHNYNNIMVTQNTYNCSAFECTWSAKFLEPSVLPLLLEIHHHLFHLIAYTLDPLPFSMEVQLRIKFSRQLRHVRKPPESVHTDLNL